MMSSRQTGHVTHLRWTAASLTLFLLTLACTVRAQITNIIYQDTFARSGLLNGSAPDTADATGAKYIAGPLIWTGNWTDQNGNTENAAYLSNSLPVAVPGPIYSEAYLPINVETGHVYTISASILVNTNFNENWIALGYSSCPTLQLIQNDYSLWMLIRSTNNPSGNGNLQAFTGASTGGGVTYNFTPSGTPWSPHFITYSLVLSITNPSAITGYWCTNGVPIRTNNFGSSFPGADNGIWPHYLAFAQTPGCAGYITNLTFTDVVPNPAAPTIIEQPNNLTAHQGQTATFWVNAVSTPDPAYQWLNNSVPIAGATNATYTTPPLSAAYNGANFSVAITNVAGSVTSSPATLTVTSGNPVVYSATKTASPTMIVVNFSSALDPTTSQNPANYSLNNGASVVSVSPGSVPSSVVLTTSTLDPAAPYYLTVNHVQDLFGDAMAAASTNAVLPAGLVLDLEGDSGVQVDTNGSVVLWLDQTTNGNNASQFFGMNPAISGLAIPGPQARPTTGVTINGLETLTFNSANDSFLTAASTPSLSINTNLTIYCVAKVSDTSISRFLFGKTVGNIPGSYELDAVNNNSTFPGTAEASLISGDAGSGNTSVSGGSGSPLTPHVYAATRAFAFTYTNNYGAAPAISTNTYYTCSNTVSVYFDGSEVVSNAASVEGAPGYNDGQQPLYIGMREDHYASDIMNGQIMQILVFNTPLSAADMTNVDNYLGAKWFNGVTFAGAIPTITTSNGFPVTISPYPSSGSTHLSGYQWQENGTNLPGATGSTYTTGILAPSDNGDTFSLIVTLYNGLTYTNTTSLAVLNQPPYATFAAIPIWSQTNIIVVFDEAVDSTTATEAANYSLNNGATVLSAAMGDTPNKVVLTTSPLTWNDTKNVGYYALTVQNVQDLYGNTIVTASPLVGLYPPNVSLWVKADTGVTADESGNVSQWNDLSGNANDLFTISAISPLLATNNHGNAVISFVATNHNQMDASSSPSLAITNDISIIAVMNFASRSGEIAGKGAPYPNGNFPAPYDCSMTGSGDTVVRGNGSNTGYGSSTATNAPSVLGVSHIVALSESGDNVSHFLDGNPVGTSILSRGWHESEDADNGQDLTIGWRDYSASGDQYLTGTISEMAIIGSAISSNDLVSLENYLASKYIIPTGTKSYPAITAQPPAVTNVYQTTTLTVPVGVTGNPLALQWYDTNGVAIAGQTNASLVLPDVQTHDSYYLVATNIYGSAISSSVILNVIPVNSNPTNIVFGITNNQLYLTWPTDHTGWQLQAQTNNLSAGLGTNWVNVTGTTGTNQLVIPISLTNGSVFYRLVFP